MKMKKEKILISLLTNIVKITFLVLIIYNILYIINTEFKNRDYIRIFNLSIFTLNDNQMFPHFKKGDLVIVNNKKINLENNDIIALEDGRNIFIKRIQYISFNNMMQKSYNIKTDASYYYDEIKKESDIMSNCIFRIPIIGNIFSLFESIFSLIIIMIIIILIIKYNSFKIKKAEKRKFKKEKRTTRDHRGHLKLVQKRTKRDR